MSRVLLVKTEREEFRITIPDTAKVTFGPFSPPSKTSGYDHNPSKAEGTLRVYNRTKDNIIFCYTGVLSFRDTMVEFSKKITTEEVSTLWQSDDGTYRREESGKKHTQWVDPDAFATALPPPPTRKARAK
jgi:hypothetical protein